MKLSSHITQQMHFTFIKTSSNLNKVHSNKGKYYWLSDIKLQILKEDNGELVKSVAVKANNFIINSSDNIVLINNATKELNYYTSDGILVDHIPIDNFTPGLRLSFTKDGEPLFYSGTSIYL